MTRTLPLMAAVLVVACGGICSAEEPARAFLKGLRERGYFDMAIQYLDSAATNELIPEEFRDTVDLEKAVTLVASSRKERDTKVRRQQLDQAQQLLAQFVGQHADHPQANTARSQLGGLLTERARIQVDAAEKGDRQAKLAEARKLYAEARKVFADHQKLVRAELEKIPQVLDREDETQANLAERRNQLRADYLQTELWATAALEETADTFAKDSKEFARVLEEAAEKYQTIYKKYRTRLAGLYARLYQGRVNQKMGKYRDALGYYVELLDQPDTPEQFRVLKTKTLRQAADCWLHKSQNKYVEAIQRLSAWVATANPQEESARDWLYLRLSLARAHMRQVNDEKSTNQVKIASRNEAEKQAKIVARYEGENQRAANLILAELGSRVASDGPVRTFDQARVAAKEKLDATEPARVLLAELRSAKPSADEAEEESRRTRIAAAESALSAAQEEAISACRLALRLADQSSPAEEVNLVRYYLAYLFYTHGDYYDGAMLAEFVAQRYPESVSARQCAEIGMACFRELYSQASGDREFEQRRLIAAAEFILDHWPDRPEADAAVATLIPFLIQSERTDEARRYLENLSGDSAQRGRASLQVGMALWQQHLKKSPPERSAEKAQTIVANSYELLREGADILAGQAPRDGVVATAMLCLAQACLETDRTADAIKTMNDPQSGPLTLVRNQDPLAATPGFAEDTYKTALRAHISSLNQAADVAAVINTTRELMAEMTAAFGDGPAGQKKLIRVYVAIAREIEEQLKVASPEARAALSEGFEAFLTQLSSGSTELSILNWVAETFSSLGAGLNTGPGLNPTSIRYYAKSAEAFQNLLKRVNLEPAMRLQIQVRLAEVHRSMGKYEEALEEFSKVLSQHNTALNVQVAAAQTHQLWAASVDGPQRGEIFERAMRGDFPDPATRKNTLWGWGKIANVTAKYKQHRDIFHTARYNLATCRLRVAETKRGEDRARQLEMAVKDVSLTRRLYGLGDANWKKRYDALVKQIQRAKGDPPIGLQAFESTGE